jgi:transposase
MRAKRRKLTREFKLEAVRLARESGKSPSQVARELGICPDWLRTWKAQLDGRADRPAWEGFSGHGKLTSQEEELRRLRQENAILQQARDF